MPTEIGLVFIAAGLYFALWKPDQLFSLLLFSTVFPATSAVTFGSLWVMPYNILALLFVVSQYLRRKSDPTSATFSGKTILLAFAALGSVSAFLCPIIFAGVPVYSPRLGSSDDTFTTFPLVFNVGNLAQSAYLILNACVVFSAATVAKEDSIWRGVNAAFYCVMGTISIELICLITGVAFPYGLIENNPDRSSLLARVIDPSARLQGTCGEPSYSGLVLLIFFAAFFHRYYAGKSGGFQALVSAVAIFLVRSGAALIGLVIVGLAVILSHPPIRFPVVLRVQRSVRLLPLVFIISLAYSSALVKGVIVEWVVDKPTSGSYEHRTIMDNYSLSLVTQTYGLGVGVGSYRPSGLWASLIGNVGIVGTILFGLLCVQIAILVARDKAWLRWSLLAALIDMGIAIPDINQPILWALIALIVWGRQTKEMGVPGQTELCIS